MKTPTIISFMLANDHPEYLSTGPLTVPRRAGLSFIFLLVTMVMTSIASIADEPSSDDGDAATVVRHLVFFDFKDNSSDTDIQSVVKAFDALPSKIDVIKHYASGPVINPNKMSAGYDHAFMVTFADDAGRAVYLPHPAHQAFVEVLKPHLGKVFVLDYDGVAAGADDIASAPGIKHAVFFKFKDDADPAAIKRIEQTFLDLKTAIGSVRHLDGGVNNSPESHDQGFTHGFVVSFDSTDDLKAYGPHPAHQKLVELLGPVMSEVRVIDFKVAAE